MDATVGSNESLPLIAKFWINHMMEIPAIQENPELLPVVYEMLGPRFTVS